MSSDLEPAGAFSTAAGMVPSTVPRPPRRRAQLTPVSGSRARVRWAPAGSTGSLSVRWTLGYQMKLPDHRQ